MKTNGGFLVTKIKQLGDRIFEKILSEKNIDAFNGAQGRILYVLWQEDGIPIRSLSVKCGLAITSLTTMLERMEHQGLISRVQSETDKRSKLYLNVYQKNARAISFYKREGFEIQHSGLDEATGEKDYVMTWQHK